MAEIPTNIITKGTKYQNISEVSGDAHSRTTMALAPLPSNKKEMQPHTQLINTEETALSNQGIDVSQPPGIINARYVKQLMTPSGLKPVVLLTDLDVPLDVEYDYMPHCALPEQGHVWSGRFNSVAIVGDPAISSHVHFNLRTIYYQRPFQYFNSHVIVRLICKPALSQSQVLWVSRSADLLDFNTKRHINEIGFTWIPSQANEIFVLMPWFNENYVVPTETNLSSVFGYINVRNLTPIVSAEGNNVPLDITYYFAPHNMYTYNPLPVNAEHIGMSKTTITLATGDFQFDGGLPGGDITPFGVIQTYGDSYFRIKELVLDMTINTGIITPLTQTCEIYISQAGDSNLYHTLVYGTGIPENIWPLKGSVKTNHDGVYGHGTYTIGYILYDSAGLQRPATIRTGTTFGLDVIYTGEEPIYSPATLFHEQGKTGVEGRLKEIKPTFQPIVVNYDELPVIGVYLNNGISNTISKISAAFHAIDYVIGEKSNVISQAPDLIEYTLLHDSKVIFKSYGSTKKQAKYDGFEAILPYLQKIAIAKRLEIVEEQIFEYKYDSLSDTASKTYGTMIDHNRREDHHYMFLDTLEINATNKFTPFNFNINLSHVGSIYPFVNTREYHRHLLKSRMPIVSIRSNKSPYSNLLCRLVQGTYTSLDELMQLPGPEWDPTITDLAVQPYWTHQTPGVIDLDIPMTLFLLSGQIDISGLQLVVFFNTSTLDYHHRIDYNATQPPPSEEVRYDPVVAGILKDLEMCSKCAISPCSCELLKTRKPKSIGVFQEEGLDSLTALEEKNVQVIGQSSSTQLEGVTMETMRETTALETGKTQTEKDYHFVGVCNTPINVTKFIVIPLSHLSFGKMEVTTAKKYHLWMGEPSFKISSALSSIEPGILYISQVPADFDFANADAEDTIRMYSNTQQMTWNESINFPVKWFNPIPTQKVDYTSTSTPLPQLGYIVISVPTQTVTQGQPIASNLKITVHCNTSNIGYKLPTYRYTDFTYPGFKYALYTRPSL